MSATRDKWRTAIAYGDKHSVVLRGYDVAIVVQVICETGGLTFVCQHERQNTCDGGTAPRDDGVGRD